MGMNQFRNNAVSVGTLRDLGAGGFSDDTLMVTCVFAESKYDVVIEANQRLVKENDEFAKKIEKLQYENEKIRQLSLKGSYQ